MEQAYCRGCGRTSAWLLAATEANPDMPPVRYWRCTTCHLMRIQYGNLPDSEGLCRVVLARSLTGGNRGIVKATGEPLSHDGLDYGDALGWLQLQLWILYTRFDQSHGDGTGSFKGWATPLLAARLVDWYRKQHLVSRDGQPLEVQQVVSYDELIGSSRNRDDGSPGDTRSPAASVGGLDGTLAAFTHDPLEDRSPDLARALARGSRLADGDQGKRDQGEDETPA